MLGGESRWGALATIRTEFEDFDFRPVVAPFASGLVGLRRGPTMDQARAVVAATRARRLVLTTRPR